MNYKRREIKREKEEPLLRGHQPAEQRRPGGASADWELRDCCSGVDWSCTETVLVTQAGHLSEQGYYSGTFHLLSIPPAERVGLTKLRGAGGRLKPQGCMVSLIIPAQVVLLLPQPWIVPLQLFQCITRLGTSILGARTRAGYISTYMSTHVPTYVGNSTVYVGWILPRSEGHWFQRSCVCTM